MQCPHNIVATYPVVRIRVHIVSREDVVIKRCAEGMSHTISMRLVFLIIDIVTAIPGTILGTRVRAVVVCFAAAAAAFGKRLRLKTAHKAAVVLKVLCGFVLLTLLLEGIRDNTTNDSPGHMWNRRQACGIDAQPHTLRTLG